MIAARDTELGSEVKLTLPDDVQSFHLQHLPHPHRVTRNHGVREAAVGRVSVVNEMTVPHRVELI